ncbi:chromosome segregation protein SMC [Myxococcota bacterium]|nr:chromosome segregation protein SMC [Myxococcota bacterium]
MHIRKLEIHGFKSFPDRQVFHFGPGISGVVGPNGCGKSNVVDAVKWCLGEQSAKSLRGAQMADVIFAGTQDRPATGMAEVSLTFAAADGEPFPGEYARHAELQVTRRLYRDGRGEYRINNARARLKDIQDLFLDTGANNRLYSFIEQGRIGQIISARPEQRRELIEEAAGISRYKARKEEAEQKLQGTLENLEQAGRSLDELGTRLRSLERQVRKAVRFRRLKSRVRQGEIFLGLARFAGLVGDRRALAEKMRGAEADEAAAIRDVTRREEVLAQARQALEALEEQAGAVRDELAELEASRRESESARLYQAREAEELGRRVTSLLADATGAEDQATAARARHEEVRRAREQGAVRVGALEGELVAIRQAVEQAEAALRQRRQRIEASKDVVLRQVQQVARDRAGLEGTRQRQVELAQRRDRLRERKDEVGTGIANMEGSLAEARANEAAAGERALATRDALEQARVREGAARAGREAAHGAVQAANAEVDRAHRDLSAAERAVAAAQARLESLQALQASHAGVDDAVKQVLGLPGMRGTLAEHLDVPRELEALVSVVLGPALDLALAADDAAAAAALAAARGGRVAVLSLEGPAPAEGELVSRLSGSADGKRALARLLGPCRVVGTVPEALATWRAEGCPVAVTSEPPAFVSARGVLSQGAAGGAGAAILARRRQIAAQEAELVGLQQAAGSAAQARDRAAAALEQARAGEARAAGVHEEARRAVDHARSAASEAEVAVRMAQRERQDAERGRDGELARQLGLQRELEGLDAQVAQLSGQAEGLAARLAEGMEAQARAEETLRADQAGLPQDEAAADRAREARAQLASEAAGLRERQVALEREEQALLSGAEQAAARAGAARAQAEQAQARIAALGADDLRLDALLVELAERQARLQGRLSDARKAVTSSREEIHRQDEALRGARDKQAAATAARAGIDRQLAQVKADITHIRDSLEERHEVSAAGLLDRLDRVGHVVISADEGAKNELPPDEEQVAVEDLRITKALLDDEEAVAGWVQRLQADRTALDRLGEVNLVAQQEYDEVKERHDALEAQRLDLEESIRTIRQTIGALNKTCRERFRDTFDRVNAYFQETYPRLVGGGMAKLLLTNEEDLLETGVDIMVQPPGKKLQQLTLLSGGEMAMTAIALIFSLFRVKPSPFCLLDEVDAPLDEGNGARFNLTLREMAKLSQFIVITHNKKTMECADTLYGVTMVVPGVSRLVSVQLE